MLGLSLLLCFLPQLFFTQLQVGLIQQVWGTGRVGVQRGCLVLWVELTLCPPLQWMVPTIQNSMKPFKVSGQAPLWLEGVWPGSQLSLVPAGYGLFPHHRAPPEAGGELAGPGGGGRT